MMQIPDETVPAAVDAIEQLQIIPLATAATEPIASENSTERTMSENSLVALIAHLNSLNPPNAQTWRLNKDIPTKNWFECTLCPARSESTTEIISHVLANADSLANAHEIISTITFNNVKFKNFDHAMLHALTKEHRDNVAARSAFVAKEEAYDADQKIKAAIKATRDAIEKKRIIKSMCCRSQQN